MSLDPVKRTSPAPHSNNVLPPAIAQALDAVIQKMHNLRLTHPIPIPQSVRLHSQLSCRELRGRALKVDSKTYFQLANLKQETGDIQGYEAYLSLAAAGVRNPDSKFQYLTKIYHSQFERKNYRGALSTCLEMVELASDRIEWIFPQARCHLYLHQFEQAIALYNKLGESDQLRRQELRPFCEQAAKDLIEVYENTSIKIASTTIHEGMLINLCNFQILLGHYTEALSTLDQLARFLPEDDIFEILSQALCYLKLRDYDSAFRLYNLILDLGPERLLQEKEECLTAIDDLQLVQQQCSDPAIKLELLNFIHEFHLLLDQHADAYETCLEIEMIAPHSTMLEQIQALYKAGEFSWEEAIESFKQAYLNRKELQVHGQMLLGLAGTFNVAGLNELATQYQSWAQELNP